MGGRGAGSRARTAGLHRDDGLSPRDAARDAGEVARVAEALEVEQDHVGARILRPVLEEVVGRDVGLVPDGDEGRDAEVQARGVVEQGEAERAALRGQADVSFGRIGRRERRVQAEGGIRVHQAHAVGADHAHAGVADLLEQGCLAATPFLSRFAEARGDHDNALDALGHAVVDRRRDRGGRDRDHREVDGPVDVGQAAVAASSLDFRRGRVHRIDGPGEAGRKQVVEDLRADLPALAAGSDHGHRAGLEEPGHRCRGRLLGAVRRLLLEVRRRRQRHLDPFVSGCREPPHRKAAAGEDVEHARVRPLRPRLEGRDAARAGDRGEPLEQPRADALAAQGTLDGERHLRARGVGCVAAVVPDGDDPARAFADVSVPIAVIHAARGRRRLRIGAVDAEELEIHAVGRKPPLEVRKGRGVLGADGAQPQGRSRAQHDVRRLVRGIVGRRCAGVGHASRNDVRFRPSTRVPAASSARCPRGAAWR